MGVTVEKKKELKKMLKQAIREIEHSLEMLKGIDKLSEGEAAALKNKVFYYLNDIASPALNGAITTSIYLNSNQKPY